MTGNGLHHLFMVIYGMVYYCFAHITPKIDNETMGLYPLVISRNYGNIC